MSEHVFYVEFHRISKRFPKYYQYHQNFICVCQHLTQILSLLKKRKEWISTRYVETSTHSVDMIQIMVEYFLFTGC